MFTGLIEETGRVSWLRRSSQSGLQIQISAPGISRGLHRGDSVAINGCCLTVLPPSLRWKKRATTTGWRWVCRRSFPILW